LGEGGEAKSMMGIRNFNLQSSRVRKRRKIGLNQPFMYIRPFSPLSAQFFYLPLFGSIAEKLFLGRNNIRGAFTPFHHVTLIRENNDKLPRLIKADTFFTS
jgi:hypothetical protein